MSHSTANPKPRNEKVKNFLLEKYQHKLSPAALNLTRGDLLDLAKNELGPHVLKITVGDLKTLNEVLTKYTEGEDVGLMAARSIKACCCCTPCCCCTGVATVDHLSHN